MPRNLVLLVLDSLRFDALMAARPRVLPRLGEIQRRDSYATWTSPSHFNLLMGLLPHPSPRGVVASAWYQEDLGRHRDRLLLPEAGFLSMLPSLWFPSFLQAQGYHTGALVSMPVLNPATPLNRGFDHYEQLPRHNDLRQALDRLHFPVGRPCFWLINTGEAHYPYALPDEPEGEWPRLHGVGGVFQRLGNGRPLSREEAPRAFDEAALQRLRHRQIRAAAWLDGAIERLLDEVPRGTWVVVTSDHGELFGEGGWFGHGPIPHRKVLEVPLVEGLAR